MEELSTSYSVRLLPHALADGPHNMAADEVLLEAAAAGVASLRLYGWSEPTLSLGYFQPERLRQANPRLSALPWVRRPSGGDTLVHHHEITYALGLPAGPPWQDKEPWPRRMHHVLAAALGELGVAALPHETAAKPERFTGVLCFQHWTPGDLLVMTSKIVGSAQRRQRGAVLQHGALLLAASPHTPELPGILELTGLRLTVEQTAAAVLRCFQEETGWALREAAWTETEGRRIGELVAEKYGQEWWNRKR